MLRQTLQSIGEQTHELSSLEVIVVSQTPEIQQQILVDNPQLTIKVFNQPESETISALRNFGVKQALGEYLAFLDADVWLSPNWTQQMIQELSNSPNRIITSAMQICDDSAPPLEEIRTCLSNAELDTDVAFLPGRNLFLHQSSFAKIGGFPEHLVTCEDYFFTDKAASLGKLYYTSSATYVHLGEDKEYPAMFKKEIWRGQSNLQSIAGRHIPLREWPSFAVPPAIMVLLVIALVLVFTQYLTLSLIVFLLAVFPIFIYSLRLYKLSKQQIAFSHILKFYIFYFPARAIGTVVGLFKSIGIKDKA